MSGSLELISSSVCEIGSQYMAAQTHMRDLRTKALEDNQTTQQLIRDREIAATQVQVAQATLERARDVLEKVEVRCVLAQNAFKVLVDASTKADADLNFLRQQLEACAATPVPRMPCSLD
jgi:outer membrane protein TolC